MLVAERWTIPRKLKVKKDNQIAHVALELFNAECVVFTKLVCAKVTITRTKLFSHDLSPYI